MNIEKNTMLTEEVEEIEVYVALSAEFIHPGHINLIEHAASVGSVTVGLLTDAAISSRRRLPVLNYDQRLQLVRGLKGVSRVIPQDDWSYVPNILRHKPKVFVHGDDWLVGPEHQLRAQVVNALSTYGGSLVEIPHTAGLSSSALRAASETAATSVDARRSMLRRSLDTGKFLRFLEVHSPLSAIVVERSVFERGGLERRFDGFWSSSLTDSTLLGKPDTESVAIQTRLRRIDEIFEVTSLPLIFDGDTGGQPEHFALNVRSMERLGISAVIIEDKRGLKKNSLLGNSVAQSQESVDEFVDKLRIANSAKGSTEFMVVARIESLILEAGMDDAILRARAYVQGGADAVMIHSKSSRPDEVFRFAKIFRSDFPTVPLICVPTTYNSVTESELQDAGFNLAIYANHLLRASFPAMEAAAMQILEDESSLGTDESIASISRILRFIPGTA